MSLDSPLYFGFIEISLKARRGGSQVLNPELRRPRQEDCWSSSRTQRGPVSEKGGGRGRRNKEKEQEKEKYFAPF